MPGSSPLFALMAIEIMLSLMMVNLAFSQDDYPHREKYPDVEFISTEDLKKRYHDVMIVFDAVRIKKAIHIAIGDTDFTRQLEKYRDRENEYTLVFYCYGHSCEKSYKATPKAQKLGLQNILCYDSGIMDWSQAYPHLSTLMGRPLSAFNKMISKSEYQSRLASLEEFRSKATDADVIVIDIRSHSQRMNTPSPALEGIRTAPLDDFLKLVTLRKFRDKELLLYDTVGKQVRWLHYYLKEYGYTRFKFLKGGVGHQ